MQHLKDPWSIIFVIKIFLKVSISKKTSSSFLQLVCNLSITTFRSLFKLQQNTVDLKVIKGLFIIPTIECNLKIHNRTQRVMIILMKNMKSLRLLQQPQLKAWIFRSRFFCRGQIRINNFPRNKYHRQPFWDEFCLIEAD